MSETNNESDPIQFNGLDVLTVYMSKKPELFNEEGKRIFYEAALSDGSIQNVPADLLEDRMIFKPQE